LDFQIKTVFPGEDLDIRLKKTQWTLSRTKEQPL